MAGTGHHPLHYWLTDDALIVAYREGRCKMGTLATIGIFAAVTLAR
jgi:hypothetical protein